ncbi:hypothetical protein UA75_06790 [Actinoalloteichus sp. GBA129-24]|uniref:Uncharacterized protein n=1 Tax=Actinoalloteichus fjordicus TaxID=1612552 RepID=A0AAC9PQU4_9PSEU|nr:hypothetical protein UA74_06795 [Actinoalloteichus fjordicus]APU19379.1 hypothetical protein UA75_06790 [Actinoalloteichus sp. GBA129-24]
MTSFGRVAQVRASDSLADWIRTHGHSVSTLDLDAPLEDLGPLAEIVGSARVVGLGESSHHVEEFYQCAIGCCASSSSGAASPSSRWKRRTRWSRRGRLWRLHLSRRFPLSGGAARSAGT